MSLLSNRCLAGLGKNTVSAVSNKQPRLTLCGKKLQNRCVGAADQERRRKQGRQEGAGMTKKTKQKKESEDK